jgi:16S rRNA (guanine1516-N2)-methyltransferase
MGRIHDFSYLKLRLQITIQLSDAWLFYSIVFRLSRITFPAGHNQWNNTITPAINDIAIAPETMAQQKKAQYLAKQLSLPLATVGDISFSFLLILTEKRLELRRNGTNAPGPVYVDFTGGKADYRRRHGGGRKQTLVRAVGLKRGHRPAVLDTTGGLGRDAFVLAGQGCRVTMIEKHPVIAALLADGLQRAAQDPDIGGMVKERLSFTEGDSLEILLKLPADQRPDVVYLDPMYPHRSKGGQVKKEMQVLRALIGKDSDSDKLLAAALKTASKRVVVKRPSYAPPLSGPEPDMTYKTKKNRFDVYLVKPA